MPQNSPKRVPAPGHKRHHVSYGVSITCECGWQTTTHYGPGASREAHADHRTHAEKHATPSALTEVTHEAEHD